MTTLAYKDGVMACDSAWVASETYVSYATKIRRTSVGCLLGCAGEGDTREVEKFFNKVKTPEQIPTRAELDKFNINGVCLFVFPAPRIWIIDLEPSHTTGGSSAWEVLGFECFAIGSGDKFARGAMACGKTAAEAVLLACQFDAMSKPPIHFVGFNSKKSGIYVPE